MRRPDDWGKVISRVVAWFIVVFIAAQLILFVTQHPPGTLHHGIVKLAACNDGFGGESKVVIDYNGTPQAYDVRYSTCLIFSLNVGRGITVQDNAWNGTWDWYRFDEVKS